MARDDGASNDGIQASRKRYLVRSREFCRMMCGDIAVESVAGEGSTFTVTLPLVCKEAEAAQ
jgi:light-regulated signal transduction histidine kinase (bacteriophytochrome)